jgi:hypothetical protein
MRVKIADRVQVSEAHHRAPGATGMIISKRHATFGGGLMGALARVGRKIRGEPVWVRFDQPQGDDDGDGS